MISTMGRLRMLKRALGSGIVNVQNALTSSSGVATLRWYGSFRWKTASAFLLKPWPALLEPRLIAIGGDEGRTGVNLTAQLRQSSTTFLESRHLMSIRIPYWYCCTSSSDPLTG
ncbi:hypothetical protein JG687_00013873 [Phytophthora cactorum]|uniref:Uncharacterized protein n=1 Tax=Phytophthora cactorum TaxID=29920 RepID=A0A8T1U054_9STRA|nr:hypothetical protein JG687_00013873 [Phytophthora cactorum]